MKILCFRGSDHTLQHSQYTGEESLSSAKKRMEKQLGEQQKFVDKKAFAACNRIRQSLKKVRDAEIAKVRLATHMHTAGKTKI